MLRNPYFFLVKYFEVVATDYKVAVKDGIVDAKAQPKKAAVYMGGKNLINIHKGKLTTMI